jgi:acetoin utilization deacetylase AcuC-like enzyme
MLRSFLCCLLPLASSLLPLTVYVPSNHALHRPPPGTSHPEVPVRIEAASAALSTLPNATFVSVPAVSDEAAAALLPLLERAHSATLLGAIRSTSARGGGGMDADTYCAPGSYSAALTSARAWLDAAGVARDSRGPSLALARPPGHHATRGAAMGFCLVNFAAIAALDAVASNRTVSVLDFDVHHGNGVADILRGVPGTRYASAHEAGGFPMTGEADGSSANVLSVPLPRGAGRGPFLAGVERCCAFLLRPPPDLLVVCAGFDGLAADELATMSLEPEDYGAAVEIVAANFDMRRAVFGLEGGYCLDEERGMPAALRAAVEAAQRSRKRSHE